MNRIMIIIIILSSIISCTKEDNNVPAYIKIDNITLNDNSTHKITDAWVYIDDNLQGVYELPADFPVLANGKHRLRVKAGIKDNGIAASRIPYSFYSSFIEEQDFKQEEPLIINPIVSYLDSVKFDLNEDFEGVGIRLETTLMSDTSIIKLNNGSNSYGGGILSDSLFIFEIATDELNDLPKSGAPVYLELDYKCNTQFLVGLYVNFPQSSVLQKDLLWINPKEDWNKIYVNLTSSISEAVGANSFQIFIAMQRDFTLNTNNIYFDNIRVVY